MLSPKQARVTSGRCPQCDVVVLPKQTPKGHFYITTYCSRKCARASWNEPIASRICGECGAEFTRKPSDRDRPYCSTRCGGNARRNSKGHGRIRNGYPVFWTGKAEVLVHRIVMEGILGRQLTSTENVHHLNGDRGDFRAENLELWDFAQPHGQRVTDKIAWCVQYLEAHGLTVSGSAVASPTSRIPSSAVATTWNVKKLAHVTASAEIAPPSCG